MEDVGSALCHPRFKKARKDVPILVTSEISVARRRVNFVWELSAYLLHGSCIRRGWMARVGDGSSSGSPKEERPNVIFF